MEIKIGDSMFGTKSTAKISPKLMEWLRQQWKISNHPKYQHYFGEWINNITQNQVDSFEKQMWNQENNVLGLKFV